MINCGYFLKKMSPRHLKNRPIWSHWKQAMGADLKQAYIRRIKLGQIIKQFEFSKSVKVFMLKGPHWILKITVANLINIFHL